MLTFLRLIEFQTHADFSLSFDKHITTLIGETEAGKSSVLRGIKFACLNKPSGDKFIRWNHLKPRGHKTAKAILKVDGHKLVRRKGRKTNCYLLDGKKLDAVGTNVPDAVSNLLNIGEENFQNQLDAPYWFMETAGQVSRNLNAIVNLSLIDSTLSNIASELRKAKIAVDLSNERLVDHERRRKELAWVKEAESDLVEIEELYGRIQEGDEKRARISATVQEGKTYAELLQTASTAFLDGGRLLDEGAAIVEKDGRIESLRSSLEKLIVMTNSKAIAEERLRVSENKLSAVKTCPACGKSLRG